MDYRSKWQFITAVYTKDLLVQVIFLVILQSVAVWFMLHWSEPFLNEMYPVMTYGECHQISVLLHHDQWPTCIRINENKITSHGYDYTPVGRDIHVIKCALKSQYFVHAFGYKYQFMYMYGQHGTINIIRKVHVSVCKVLRNFNGYVSHVFSGWFKYEVWALFILPSASTVKEVCNVCTNMSMETTKDIARPMDCRPISLSLILSCTKPHALNTCTCMGT